MPVKPTDFIVLTHFWRVHASGDCDKIPCLDKKAPPRKQVKRHLVHGITIEKLDVGDYYGFELDGDKLFLLGDFTVTHNTETTKLFCNLHYYNTEPKMLTPNSTLFAVSSSIAGSSSIPLVLDEFKPAEMNPQIMTSLSCCCVMRITAEQWSAEAVLGRVTTTAQSTAHNLLHP